MLKHIVLFKFKDTANGKTKAENLEAARARMLALKEEIPEIVDLEVYFGAPAPPREITITSWCPPSGIWRRCSATRTTPAMWPSASS